MPNAFSPFSRGYAAAAVLTIIAAITGAVTLSQPAHASRAVLRDQALYVVDGTASKRLVVPGAVASVFADTNGTALFSVQRDIGHTDSEDLGTVDLYFNGDLRAPIRLAGPIMSATLDLPRRLAYYTTPSAELRRVRLDGTDDQHVADKALSPAVAPDGTRLVFQKLPADWTAGNYYDRALGLTVLDLATGSEHRVTDAWEDFGATWSPDGTTLLFGSANPRGIASLYAVSANGGHKRQLTNVGHDRIRPDTVPVPSERPQWSPDGNAITFASDNAVWYVGTDKALAHVTAAKQLAFGHSPRWSADGKSVSVVVGNAGTPGTDLIDVDLSGSLIR
jgi:Tol biopolymer transport system component